MKKFFGMIIVMAILLAAALGLAACGPDKGECKEHVFYAWEVEQEATCSTTGLQTRKCKNCGFEQTSVIAKKPHVETLEGFIEATCLEAGFSGTKKCSVCGETIEEGHVVDALGHNMSGLVHALETDENGEQKHVHKNSCLRCGFLESKEDCDIKETVQQATCNREGFRRLSCAKCGYDEEVEHRDKLQHDFDESAATPQLDSSGVHRHKMKCTLCGTERLFYCTEAAVETHNATCLDPGYKLHRCSICGANWKTDEKAALGHKYGDEWTVVEDAKCGKAGSKYQLCTVCGTKNYKDIPALDHVWGEWEIGPIPACKDGAYNIKKCKLCQAESEEKQFLTTKKDHKFEDVWHVVTPAQCLKKGLEERYCVLCHEEKEQRDIAATGHKPQVMPYKAPTCTASGLEQGSKCSVCNTVITQQKEIPALGHIYQNEGAYTSIENESRHIAKCDRCQDEKELPCDYIDKRIAADCVTEGRLEKHCKYCKDSYIAEVYQPLGHSFRPYSNNIVKDETSEHVHKHYRQCKRGGCGYVEEGLCEWDPQKTQTHDATCTVSGFVIKECKICGVKHEEITEKAPGHNYGEDGNYSRVLLGGLPAHIQTCLTCKETTEPLLCDITYATHDATCTEAGYADGTCTVCKIEDVKNDLVPALGHQYGPWTYLGENPLTDVEHRHQRVCMHNGCDDAQTDVCKEVTDNKLPTCTSDGAQHTYCSECMTDLKNETVNSLGHKWEEAWQVDEQNGRHYHVCSQCKEAREEFDHKFETVIDAATCTTDRVLHKTCSVCQHKEDETVEDTALGHSWSAWEITADNGYANRGKHTRHCLTCEALDDEQNGTHDYSDSNVCSVCGHDGLVYELQGAHYIVANDNNVFNGNLQKPEGAKRIIIPATHNELGSEAYLPVIAIKAQAFFSNAAIESVEISNSIGTIGSYAFHNCDNLVRIDFADIDNAGLITIEKNAFLHCSQLKTFNAPNSLVSIEDSAFENCGALSEITIPEHVTHIGAKAFANTAYVAADGEHWSGNALYIGSHLIATRLTEDFDGTFEIMDGVVSVDAEAFVPLKSKLAEVILNAELKVVESDAFKDCTAITKVRFKGGMEQWLSIDFVNDFSSPLVYGASLHVDNASGIIDIPQGVTRIPAGTFRGTQISEVHIPDSVTWIGAEAFKDCAQLKVVTMTDRVTYIGKDAFTGCALYDDPDARDEFGVLYIGNHLIAADPEKCVGTYEMRQDTVTVCIGAFKDCAQLVSVSIGAKVVRIGAGVFEGCSALEEVRFEGDNDWFAQGLVGRHLEASRFADPKTARKYFDTYYGEWRVYKK